MIKEALFYNRLEDGKVQCYLCNQRCPIDPSKFGFCRVRQNLDGKLYTHAYGEVIAAHVDPIEKKPLYHFLPGTTSFSIATMGCNFRCGFCQNWQISQISEKDHPGHTGQKLPPEEAVRQAKEHRCRSISYTYTEPTIFFEYAYDIARKAKEEGLYNVFVTNGYMTAEPLETISPYLDACNVDLKSFRDDFYKKTCRGRLEPVLNSIRLMRKLNIWVEITTLLIPNLNDSEEELEELTGFIAEVDPNIPWHISRFHPDYKLTDVPSTPVDTLKRAYTLGKDHGLNYIYIGNVPWEATETICPQCHQALIRRRGFFIEENKLRDSRCSYCGRDIAGVFEP